MSALDGLLDESWSFLRSAPESSEGASFMDMVLDRGSLSFSSMVFGHFVELPTWDGPVPAIPPPLEEAASAAPRAPAFSAVSPKLKLTSSRAHPAEEDALLREAAARSWVSILDALKGATSAFIELRGKVDTESIVPYLATRRTGTLSTRASAWRLFFKWADDHELDIECIDEPMAFSYLEYLKSINAPPTRAESFMKTCHLASGILGFAIGQKIATSPRCRGLAAVSLADKRRRV